MKESKTNVFVLISAYWQQSSIYQNIQSRSNQISGKAIKKTKLNLRIQKVALFFFNIQKRESKSVETRKMATYR